MADKVQQEIREKGWRTVLREWCTAPSRDARQMYEIVRAVPSLLDLLEKTERRLVEMGGTLETGEPKEDLFS